MQNGWTNYDNGDHSNNNHNTIVEKTVVDEWSHLFRLFTSVHALRRSNARAVHFRLSIGTVSLEVEDLKRNQWDENFVCLESIYAMKVPNSNEKKSYIKLVWSVLFHQKTAKQK